MPGRGSCKLYSPEALRVSEGTRPLPLAVDGRGFHLNGRERSSAPTRRLLSAKRAADVHAFGTFRELTVSRDLSFLA